MPQEFSPLEGVEQLQLVRDWFGHWPIFHDAHVVEFNYLGVEDAVSFTLHAFEMTDRVDSAGYFELQKHCLVSFKLSGAVRVSFHDYQLGDTLMELQFAFDDGRVVARLESAIGGECVISAAACRVSSLIPCDGKGTPA